MDPYQGISAIKQGRLHCFGTIKPYIELIQSSIIQQQESQPSLTQLIDRYYSAEQLQPPPKLKIDPPSQIRHNSIKLDYSLQESKPDIKQLINLQKNTIENTSKVSINTNPKLMTKYDYSQPKYVEEDNQSGSKESRKYADIAKKYELNASNASQNSNKQQIKLSNVSNKYENNISLSKKYQNISSKYQNLLNSHQSSHKFLNNSNRYQNLSHNPSTLSKYQNDEGTNKYEIDNISNKYKYENISSKYENKQQNPSFGKFDNLSVFENQSKFDNTTKFENKVSINTTKPTDIILNANFTKKKLQQPQPLNISILGSILQDKAIRVCQFSQSGQYLAIGTNSSHIKIYEIHEYFDNDEPFSAIEPTYELQNIHLKSVFSLDWTANQKFITSCSNDATVKLTRIQNLSHHQTSLIGRHDGSIRMVRFNALENKIVSCGEDSLIKIWDINKPKQSLVLKGHYSSVNGVRLAENESSSLIYSVSKDCTIRLWDMRTGDPEAISKPHESEMTYISRNTENLVISHKNGSVSFYDRSLKLLNNTQVHSEEIRSIEASVEEKRYITSSFDGQVCVFSVNEQFEYSKTYQQHNLVNRDDKTVFATFRGDNGYASCSTFGVCNLYTIA